MRIGVLGGVPPALGGGGLEVQIRRTGEALTGLGHDVVRVEDAPRGAKWDVLHAFGAEPDVWHALNHWTRTRTPLVVSPVLVVSPGREERLLRVLSRLPVLTSARMRAETLRAADVVIALTGYEAQLISMILGGRRGPAVVRIGNGADPAPPAEPPPGLPAGDWVLLTGAVSPRKRQREVVEALGGAGARAVVAGAWGGPADELPFWRAAVARAEAVWLGDVSDPAELRAVMREARALVHLSGAETQSLAVLEALSEGTPAVLSDIPSHRELAALHPQLVRLVTRAAEIVPALSSLPLRGTARPTGIPTWREVGERLVSVYERVLGG